MKIDTKTINQIAKVAHNVNKVYCESLGDNTQLSWDESPKAHKTSYAKGVVFHMENDVTPEESHISWLDEKIKDGWRYGVEKDVEAKRHPCMIPYVNLPREQQIKDLLFKAVVNSYKPAKQEVKNG